MRKIGDVDHSGDRPRTPDLAYDLAVHHGKPPAGDRPLKTLERLISKAGLGSRTEARRWIAAGRVAVNGAPVLNPDAWVDLERDSVTFDGKPIEQEARVYLLMHKPKGVLTTYRDPEGRPTVYDLIPERDRYLFPVGRLDLATSGLLILTNDAEFAERLTNPEYHVAKTYEVKASVHLTDENLDALRNGIALRDGLTRPALVERIGDPGGKTVFHITITEGRNRQVRRMVEAVGGKVVRLVRIAIGAIAIGELQPGEFRELTPQETESLRGRKNGERSSRDV